MASRVPWRLFLFTVGASSIVFFRVIIYPRILQATNRKRKQRARLLMKEEDFYEAQGVKFEEEYITNARRMRLYAPRWLPLAGNPKAIVFMLHGYGVECGLFMSETALKLAAGGFAVYGLDYEGHGQSEGLRGYIPCIDDLVDDCISYSRTVKRKKEYLGMECFLYGASMGGAIALLIHRKDPLAWTGGVLLAPMCKVRNNPLLYLSMPRLGTALTLLNVCNDLQARLEEVTLPFLLLHGADDCVTDPSISHGLFEKSRSVDKTFMLYPGMLHCLTEGDTPEACGQVWKDIFSWLEERSQPPKVIDM